MLIMHQQNQTPTVAFYKMQNRLWGMQEQLNASEKRNQQLINCLLNIEEERSQSSISQHHNQHSHPQETPPPAHYRHDMIP
eukprot:15330130-Ditylum_brightwellii.AAC.1